MSLRAFFTGLFLLLTSYLLQASDVKAIHSLPALVNLNEHTSYIKDVDHSETLNSLRQADQQSWQQNTSNQINFGYSEATYWLKVKLKNKSPDTLDRILEIRYPVLDQLDVYFVRSQDVTDHYNLGDKLPFYERIIQNRNFLVPFQLDIDEEVEIYVKIHSSSSVQAPLYLWDPIRFHQADQSKVIFQGIYFGIALVMILYNLFIYFAVHEKTYLHYVVYITCMALFLASMNGLNFQYLWPTAIWWNDQSILFFLSGTVAFGTFFSIRFLSLSPATHLNINRYLNVLAWSSALLMVCSLLFNYRTMIQLTIYHAVITCVSLLFISFHRVVQGDISARYFIVAWIAMLFGGIVLALNKFTVLPQNIITENAAQLGSALEIILLTIALADRLNQEKRKALNAQIEALQHEREARIAQEEILKVQKEANVMLEQRVNERTSELKLLNEQLMELNATDPLTKLKNRGFLDEKFQQYYTSAYRLQQTLSILIIDIDHFKKFNDNYGHLVGDECLIMVANIIKHLVSRPQDIACRYGGEEFVILLPETDEDGAHQVAEKIRKKVAEEPFQVADKTLNITVSIGTNTITPINSIDRKIMFDQADEALYTAKNRGRNQVATYVKESSDHT